MIMHNRYGTKFCIEIWGASHSPNMGVRIEGVPRGIALSESDFEADIARRRAGAKGTTARHESDIPTIASGVADGKTMLELSRELGISLEACKKRVQRAREYLKKELNEHGKTV